MLSGSQQSTSRMRRRLAAAAVSLSLVLAACGGSDDASDNDTGTDDTDTTEQEAPETTEAAEPEAPVVTEPPVPEAEPQYGGAIVVGLEAETGSPWLPSTMVCAVACQNVARTFYDPLMVLDNDLELKPYLLESIEANDDNTVYTMKVREGITFHDGTELNADVVIDNLNRTASGFLISRAVTDLARNEDGTLVLAKLDDYTLTIATGKNGDPNQPLNWPLFPYTLTTQLGLMASSQWMADVEAGNADATLPVGTGPYTLVEFVPGDRTVVERNPNYWQSDENGNQLPYLDRITFRPIEDTQVREEALKSGDLTLMHLSDGSIIERLKGDPNLDEYEQNQFSETNYALLNFNAEVMQSKEVRCALLQALDPQDLIDVVAFGAGTVSNGPFTPGQEGFLADNGRLPYDPEAARAAVEAWEAENGPLVINITSTPTPANKRTADFLLSAWGDVGIDVNINEIEQASLIGTALQGRPEDFELFFWRNHAGLFVDQQYYWWHGDTATEAGSFSLNFGRLNDPVVNELLELSRSESDPEVRRGYAEDINRRFASECLILPTTQTQWSVFTDPSVQNFGRSPIPDHDGFARDGAGFPGQVFFHALYLAD